MKLNKIFLGCAAAMALASCVNEDFSKSAGKDSGRLEVGVETLEPMKTRAEVYTVTNFPVTIYEADGTTKVQSYETVSAMPAQILLPTGNYVLEAHTPGVMERIMNAPYYKGTETSEIQKDLTTQSTITCKMANTSVTVHYDQDFLDLFTSWTITFDDGTDNAVSFTNENGDTPATLYWDLGEGVQKLTVNFRGVNKDGTVTAKNDLTKSQATETYDGQSTNFAGGDAVVVNFTPVEATTGYVTIGITANIFGTDAEPVPAIVEIVDNGTFTPDTGGEEPGPGPEPGGDDVIPTDGSPYFICPALKTGVTVQLYYDEEEDALLPVADTPQTVIEVHTPKGLKSLKVSITGGNKGFAGATASMQNLEIIGSSDLGDIFAEVDGAELPVQGQTEYSFPVYAFYSKIALFGKTDAGKAHEFYMVAEDMDGNIKTGTLKVTVNE